MSKYSFIPESHYVFILESPHDTSKAGLGFMVSEHDKFVKAEQYENRVKTAQKWAGSYGKHSKIFVPNIPRSGFKVISKQTRYSTSNVVWRIGHPEGFTFEISSENLSEIIEHCSIIDKEIIGELFFNTAGFLYNENFDLYIKQVKLVEDTAKIKKSQTVELVPGDIVESKGIYDYESIKMEYLGRYHCLPLEDNSSFLVHCFIDLKKDEVIFYKKLDSITICKKYSTTIPKYTSDDAIKIINNKLMNCEVSIAIIKGTYKSCNTVITVYPSPFKVEDVKISYVPTEHREKYNYTRHRCAFKDVKTNSFYSFACHYYGVSDFDTYTSQLTDIDSFRGIYVRTFWFPGARKSEENDKENLHLVKFVVDKPKRK